MFRKWNGDNKLPKGQGPHPKGDPRDKINAHNRSLAKREIRDELHKLEMEGVSDESTTLQTYSSLL